MTDEDISLEYEMFLSAAGKSLKECFKCKCTTHRDQCPVCGTELTGDKTIDEVFARIEAGEQLDLEAELRGGQWEAVQPGGSP